MVSSSSLIEFLSEKTGYRKHSLARIGVDLRKSGVIDSTGRGRNAAGITLKNAADIILAMLGANHPREASDAVNRLNHLTDDEGTKLVCFFVGILEQHRRQFCIDCIEYSHKHDTITIFSSRSSNSTQIKYVFKPKTYDRVSFDIVTRIAGCFLRDLLGYIE